MKLNKLVFSIDIQSDKAKIWKALWNENNYRKWASVFFEGSYLVAKSWEEGDHVLFLSPDKSGIYSLIEKHIPNSLIRFKHIGIVLDGKEQEMNEETKKWSGANETYSITKGVNNHILKIEIDVMDEHLDFMKDKLPKALEKIKSMSLMED